MLEGIESSTTVEDINTYKTNTRNLFEQLLLKLEENSDHIYSLEHRVKFLEQECEDKDLDIEKMTMSMQEAVNDCRQEAEEMVGELMGKVSVEVNQRHEIEGLVRRLQSDNAKLKVGSKMLNAAVYYTKTPHAYISLFSIPFHTLRPGVIPVPVYIYIYAHFQMLRYCFVVLSLSLIYTHTHTHCRIMRPCKKFLDGIKASTASLKKPPAKRLVSIKRSVKACVPLARSGRRSGIHCSYNERLK